MLDDFREDANASPYFEDETEAYYEEVKPYRPRRHILGMTAAQRFVVSILLLIMSCVVGSLMLLVFERVVPPAFF